MQIQFGYARGDYFVMFEEFSTMKGPCTRYKNVAYDNKILAESRPISKECENRSQDVCGMYITNKRRRDKYIRQKNIRVIF